MLLVQGGSLTRDTSSGSLAREGFVCVCHHLIVMMCRVSLQWNPSNQECLESLDLSLIQRVPYRGGQIVPRH